MLSSPTSCSTSLARLLVEKCIATVHRVLRRQTTVAMLPSTTPASRKAARMLTKANMLTTAMSWLRPLMELAISLVMRCGRADDKICHHNMCDGNGAFCCSQLAELSLRRSYQPHFSRRAKAGEAPQGARTGDRAGRARLHEHTVWAHEISARRGGLMGEARAQGARGPTRTRSRGRVGCVVTSLLAGSR